MRTAAPSPGDGSSIDGWMDGSWKFRRMRLDYRCSTCTILIRVLLGTNTNGDLGVQLIGGDGRSMGHQPHAITLHTSPVLLDACPARVWVCVCCACVYDCVLVLCACVLHAATPIVWCTPSISIFGILKLPAAQHKSQLSYFASSACEPYDPCRPSIPAVHTSNDASPPKEITEEKKE